MCKQEILRICIKEKEIIVKKPAEVINKYERMDILLQTDL